MTSGDPFLPSIDFTGERPEVVESATLRLVQELDTRAEQHEPGGSQD